MLLDQNPVPMGWLWHGSNLSCNQADPPKPPFTRGALRRIATGVGNQADPPKPPFTRGALRRIATGVGNQADPPKPPLLRGALRRIATGVGKGGFEKDWQLALAIEPIPPNPPC